MHLKLKLYWIVSQGDNNLIVSCCFTGDNNFIVLYCIVLFRNFIVLFRRG